MRVHNANVEPKYSSTHHKRYKRLVHCKKSRLTLVDGLSSTIARLHTRKLLIAERTNVFRTRKMKIIDALMTLAAASQCYA